MKEKILDILEKHYHGKNFIESRCADELLGLFDVVAMLPSDDEIEKAAEENASRLYATDSYQDTEWYANHHGFMDGVDFIRNNLSGNQPQFSMRNYDRYPEYPEKRKEEYRLNNRQKLTLEELKFQRKELEEDLKAEEIRKRFNN